jgi:Leucine-rich repeat (LRR) protein
VIPNTLYNLPSIEALILSSNLITEFPAELCVTNPTLTNLDLHTNKISSVPTEISALQNLRRLNIAINQIEEVPESIGDLASLEWLNINDNKLLELPESIGDLRNLIKFGIVQNKLENLPDSIGRLTQLSKLDMRRNQFRWLPGSILKLRDHQESSQTFIESRENNALHSLRPGIGSLKTILMGENEQLQYFEGIVCDGSHNETHVFSSNLENTSVERLRQLHKLASLSEIATRCLLDSITSPPSGSLASLRHYSARLSLLETLPAHILPDYTRRSIIAKSKQCESCLRLYCNGHIYVAELGCMGDSRTDIPVRFRMCSYRCAKIFIETDKSASQLYDENPNSNGLEALDHPLHDSASVLQQGGHQATAIDLLRDPSMLSSSNRKSLLLQKFLIPISLHSYFDTQYDSLALRNIYKTRFDLCFHHTLEMKISQLESTIYHDLLYYPMFRLDRLLHRTRDDM